VNFVLACYSNNGINDAIDATQYFDTIGLVTAKLSRNSAWNALLF